jgi:hypothetical protein
MNAPDMKAAGFEWDPTFSGHERWTHFPKEITCLRQPFMTDAQWEQHKAEKIEEASGGAPYCSDCGARKRQHCKCPPRPRND